MIEYLTILAQAHDHPKPTKQEKQVFTTSEKIKYLTDFSNQSATGLEYDKQKGLPSKSTTAFKKELFSGQLGDKHQALIDHINTRIERAREARKLK